MKFDRSLSHWHCEWDWAPACSGSELMMLGPSVQHIGDWPNSLDCTNLDQCAAHDDAKLCRLCYKQTNRNLTGQNVLLCIILSYARDQDYYSYRLLPNKTPSQVFRKLLYNTFTLQTFELDSRCQDIQFLSLVFPSTVSFF